MYTYQYIGLQQIYNMYLLVIMTRVLLVYWIAIMRDDSLLKPTIRIALCFQSTDRRYIDARTSLLQIRRSLVRYINSIIERGTINP